MSRFAFVAIACLCSLPAVFADDDIAAQRGRQRETQAETDFAVTRLRTLMRVLDFYQAGESAKKQALDDVAKTLAGLSKEQMSEVLRRLDAAAVAPEGKASGELAAAHAKHQEILTVLRSMLDRHGSATSIEQVADRLDELGKSQAQLFATNSDPDFQVLQRCVVEVPALTKREWLAEQRYGKRYNTEFFDTGWIAFEQSEVQKDVQRLLEQIDAMRPTLSADHARRVARMDEYAKRLKVVDKLDLSVVRLQPLKDWKVAVGGKDVKTAPPLPDKRQRDHNEGVELQGELAVHYLQMGRELRYPDEPLVRLMLARERVDASYRQQVEINGKTAPLVKKRPPVDPYLAPMPMLTDKRWELIKAAPSKVELRTPQQIADDKAHQLAVERTFREVTSREATAIFGVMDAENILASHAADVVVILTGARGEMKSARESVSRKDANDAVAPQTKAAGELELARAILDKRIGRMQKEKSDVLAALEAAADKLDAIIAAQTKNRDATDVVAKNRAKDSQLPKLTAIELDIQKDTVALARTPLPGKDKFVPPLVKAANEMSAAAKELLDKQPTPAVVKENQAIAHLLEARKALADKIAEVSKNRDEIAKLEAAGGKNNPALDKLKAQELANQAALQPKSLDPRELEKQLEKTLEHTNKAAEDAMKADELAKKQGDLADKQKEIAQFLEAKKLPEIAKAAEKAADALEKGKLEDALKAQKEALDKLNMPKNSDGDQSSAPHAPTPGDQKKIAPNPPPPPPSDKKPMPLEPMDPPMLMPPMPSAPKAIKEGTIKEIVESQKDVLNETEALARSKLMTEMALAALAQAQAQAPLALQDQLQQAANQLAQASQDLQNAAPGSALSAQLSASAALQRALNTLNIALGIVEAGPPMEYELQPTPDATPVDEAGKGDPTKMSNSPSVIPDKIGPDDKNDLGGTGGLRGQQGPADEKNSAKGTGDRQPDGKVSNTASRLDDVTGEGNYLHLPPRQRELIRQAMTGNLPPEYSTAIQQYYVNIARGRPAAGR